MKQTEELVQSLFESSPDAIFIEDGAGFVLDCNPAAAALHRMLREQVVGRHVSDLLPNEQRASFVQTDESPEEFEGFSLTADGESIPVSIRTSRIHYRGQQALLLHVRDISQRRRFERNLRALNDELELRVQNRVAALAHANEVLRNEIAERTRVEEERRQLEQQMRSAQRMEAVGRLAGGVAHDFNNLLTVIIGRCEVMMDRASGDGKLLADVMIVHDAAQKAAAVTRQLLAFGRKQTLEAKVIDINALIDSMQAMLGSLVSENIQFKISKGAGLICVEADRGQLEQVILNLVVNSIDAMPNGGELHICTALVDVTAESVKVDCRIPSGRYAAFTVRDSGRGMDAETLSHVFEPFFTTKDDKGTGLGLSTVHGIVKQSGGGISAVSEPGKGASFTVYLPAVDRSPATEEVIQAAPRGRETILIVEDAQIVRKLARELLEFRGYSVLEAATGEEAIHICENPTNSIELLLSDIIMPKMNGRELAERLKKSRPNLKILLMSGYADHITLNQLMRNGFEFIAKPFTSNALAVKVREVLDR